MNINYIRIDRELFYLIDKSELQKNEKYISLIVLNKIIFNYFFNKKTGFKPKKNIIYKEKSEENYISKSISSIDNWFGDRRTTDKCIKEWVRIGLVERGESYKKGEYSKGFLPKILPTNKFITLKAVDYLTPLQIQRLRNRVEKMKDKDIQWHLENLKKSIEVDLFELGKFIIHFFNYKPTFKSKEDMINEVMNIEISEDKIRENNPQFTEEEVKGEVERKSFYRLKILELLDIEHSEIKKGSKSGRHYHILSNTPKALKHCIVSKNPSKPYLMQVDIKNSQPFFLLCLINHKKLEIEETIRMSIVGGKFYEVIGEVLGYNYGEITTNEDIRKEVKQLIYQDIFFCKSNAIRLNSKNFKKIMERYPLFCNAIIKLSNQKSKDGKVKTLAQCLQEMETKQMIPLVKKFKGIGIHDAVLSIAVDKVETVIEIQKELIEKFTKKFTIVPKVSVEMISERKNIIDGLQYHLFTSKE